MIFCTGIHYKLILHILVGKCAEDSDVNDKLNYATKGATSKLLREAGRPMQRAYHSLTYGNAFKSLNSVCNENCQSGDVLWL